MPTTEPSATSQRRRWTRRALVAVLLGVALGGERLPATAYLAMGVIVGGVALVSVVDARRKR